jgi:hypothetical protein
MSRVRRGAGHYWFVIVVSAAALLPAGLALTQQGQGQAFTDEGVRQAIEKGVKYLWSTQLGDGSWVNVNASNVSVNGKPLPMEYRVGPTAICVYALLESGVSPAEPKLAKALEYLAKEQSEMTYCLAFRSLAYSAGLIGVMCQTINGYSPETALALVRNLVIMTSGQAVASQGAGEAAGAGALDRSNFVPTACTRNDQAAKAVDGDKKTKWDTGRPMKEGDWFQVDLGELAQIGSVMLDTQESPKDFPKSFKISLSSDGTNWASANAMNGGPAMQVTFSAGLRARFIRFEVVSVDGDQPWSIYEIEVKAPGAAKGAGKGAGKAKSAE